MCFSRYSTVIIPLAGIIAGLVVAMKLYEVGATTVKAATQAWSAVQAVFNVIMAANPIVLVVLAIAALVAGVILAYSTSRGSGTWWTGPWLRRSSRSTG